MKKLFTSESVTEGHPDKVCDQISDALLDAYLTIDPKSRVACETLITKDFVVVTGEIKSKGTINQETIIRKKLAEIGYNDEESGLDSSSCEVIVLLKSQSIDISKGVDNNFDNNIGAGDQGIMFGYACGDTEHLMPLPLELSHQLVKKLSDLRKSNEIPYLYPDGKAQVTVEYHDGKPVRVHTVVVSAHHNKLVSVDQVRNDIIQKVILETIDEDLIDTDTIIFINPTDRFVIGGPEADAGLTGRKIIVDTYGGFSKHGGGAFSGKDSSKVDRSAAYYARYVAKNIVASGIAKECEIGVSYSIGKSYPISLYVNTFGTSIYYDKEILNMVNKVFDFKPSSIIENLNLQKPIFRRTSTYGHFGENCKDLSWEQLDKIDVIRKYFS